MESNNKDCLNLFIGDTFGGISSVYNVILSTLSTRLKFVLVSYNSPLNTDFINSNLNKINLNVSTPISGFNIIVFFKNFVLTHFRNNSFRKFILTNPQIAILVYLLSNFLKISYFVHLHEPIENIIKFKSNFSKKIYIFLLKRTLKKASEVIFISKSVKQNYVNVVNFNGGLVIYNPIEIGYLIKFRKIIDLNNKKKINFVSVGRLSEAKGYDILISAATNLVNKGVFNFKINIIGDGELFNSLSSKIKLNKLEEYISLLGFIENPYEHINSADCYLSSSKWEGLGLTLLYAMALRTPIISSKTSGAIELLNNKEQLFEIENYIELSNLMNSFILNKNIFENTIETNYQKSLYFDKKIINEDFFKVFSK